MALDLDTARTFVSNMKAMQNLILRLHEVYPENLDSVEVHHKMQ